MEVVAAALVGLLAYLVAGRLLGRISFRAWPGRWRYRPSSARPSPFGDLLGPTPPGWLALGMTGSAVIGWWAAASTTGSSWLGLAVGLLAGALPLRRLAKRRLQRLADLQEAWPDGLRHLVASIRSGSAVDTAVLDLVRTGPDPLAELFGRFEALAGAMGSGAALEAIAESVADPTTDRVVEVLIVASETGGNAVPDVLEDLATAVTEDLRTVEEIRTAGLEQRLNARIVFAVPWVVLLLLTARPGLYRTFYQSRPGTVIVLAALLLSAAALIAVGRLGREPLERRVLARSKESGS